MSKTTPLLHGARHRSGAHVDDVVAVLGWVVVEVGLVVAVVVVDRVDEVVVDKAEGYLKKVIFLTCCLPHSNNKHGGSIKS